VAVRLSTECFNCRNAVRYVPAVFPVWQQLLCALPPHHQYAAVASYCAICQQRCCPQAFHAGHEACQGLQVWRVRGQAAAALPEGTQQQCRQR
jgi:hypothetical protein